MYSKTQISNFATRGEASYLQLERHLSVHAIQIYWPHLRDGPMWEWGAKPNPQTLRTRKQLERDSTREILYEPKFCWWRYGENIMSLSPSTNTDSENLLETGVTITGPDVENNHPRKPRVGPRGAISNAPLKRKTASRVISISNLKWSGHPSISPHTMYPASTQEWQPATFTSSGC